MRWRGREQSSNVRDRRGVSPRMAMGGGGSILVVIVVLVLKLLDAPPVVQNLAGQALQNVQQRAQVPAGTGIDDDHAEFVRVVLRDTEVIWTQLFGDFVQDAAYQPPVLQLFTGQTETACGRGKAAMGPFYCPADRMIYIDPTFFDELARRHNAPGDFAQAYVIAHEVAHHVQNLLGYSRAVRQQQAKSDKRIANQWSVRLELQADFLAGVWAHHADRQLDILEEGDMEEAIQAANQIGDDTLQREATGRVNVHSFTHGTSAQRVKWFRRGMLNGRMADCKALFELQYDEL